MAHEKNNDSLIKNEDTLVRRAWIESAVEGVRARVETSMSHAEVDALVREELPADVAACTDEADEADGPQLYVAWDADERRSGT
jgi:hypothetical protein